MSEINPSESIVCITGASGFIASYIVKYLLEKGYTVRGTVRNPTDESKVSHLRQIAEECGASERLHFFSGDLNVEGSFDEAIDGSHYVMHTASPYVLTVNDPQTELIDPAVNGTLTVLRSCSKFNVKKVILTSSMAALTDHPVKKYTEEDWNELSSLKRNPYYYSKMLAERSAWDYVKEKTDNGEECFKLIVINPFVVIGPALNKEGLNTSNGIYKGLFTGQYPVIMEIAWGMVDVRDVAMAHILAMENEKAQGRYICANTTLRMKEIVDFLREHYPNYKLPKTDMSCGFGTGLVKLMSNFQDSGVKDFLKTNLGCYPDFDNSKIKNDLGMEFKDMHQTILDTVEYLLDFGFIEKIE